ncbi:hypothetical protein BC833DRAFT_97141 [Globomyces pollinis-pini]|nr:hypothetical protein BC833DRAFT_97141 [Globomyces pollinis-pini]
MPFKVFIRTLWLLLLVRTLNAQSPFQKQNGISALRQDKHKMNNRVGQPCTNKRPVCVDNNIGSCISGKFIVQSQCTGNTTCNVFPAANYLGTYIECTDSVEKALRYSKIGIQLDCVNNNAVYSTVTAKLLINPTKVDDITKPSASKNGTESIRIAQPLTNATEPVIMHENDDGTKVDGEQSSVVDISTDGACGLAVGKRCPDGTCCSQYNSCGGNPKESDAWCGQGCQLKFG